MSEPMNGERLNFEPHQAEVLLANWLGHPVHCTGVRPLHGGMIHSVVRLDFAEPPLSAVVKLSCNPGEESFRREARALELLHTRTAVPCPRVYHCDLSCQALPFACLVLETLPGVPLTATSLAPADQDRVETQLADVLLELHAHTRDAYGDLDAAGAPAWTDIVVDRLRDMRQEMDQRLPASVLTDIDAAVAAAPVALADAGTPTLVHGDVWAGNIMVQPTPDGWSLSGLLDPGCGFADVESELAYLQVFGTVGSTFFRRYTAQRPLRAGFEFRRHFYWLNTWMVHVWLFGDQHYREQTARTAARIRARLASATVKG